MRDLLNRIRFIGGLAAILLMPAQGDAAPTDDQVLTAIGKGVAWLAATQNVDGSWGATEAEQLLYTSDAVRAFRATNNVGPAYVRGVAWLENHGASNSDFRARRLLALAPHNDSLASERSALAGSKAIAGTGQHAGWGLTRDYRADPWDTGLAMQALGVDAAFFTSNIDAIDGLAAILAASGGWGIGQPGEATLPFSGDLSSTIAAATAIRLCAGFGVARCAELLGVLPAVDNSLVSYPYSKPLERALATQYLAALRDSPPVPIGTIGDFVFYNLLGQSANGSWANDVLYTTAALRASASWLRLDRPDAATPVPIADAALRQAVNRSLGHHAMDGVTRGDLWRLTSLDLAYASTTTDLSALSQAGNLKTIDISGNPCLLAMPNIDATLTALFPKLTTIIKKPIGDIDRNNVANSYDQQLLLGDLLKLAALTGIDQRAADLNFDGRLDSRDLYWLDRVLFGYSVASLCQ